LDHCESPSIPRADDKEGIEMITQRRLLLGLAGAGLLVLQACSSPPPPPPPPPPAPPPPPDFSGVYNGPVTWPKGCTGPKTATLTITGTTFSMPWGRTVTFDGPVGPDGAFEGHIPASAPPEHAKKAKAHGRPGIDMMGNVTTDGTAAGQVKLIKCVGTFTLKKG
jgi:hypothetical protein